MSNFQSNVDNMYLQSMVPSSNRAAELEAEKRRTQGIINLVRALKGQPLTAGSSSYASSTQSAMPSRAEIETEQLHKGIQEQGITTQQGVAELLSDSGASFEASDLIRKNLPLYNLGDPVNLYQVANGRVVPLEESFQSKDISGIESAISQGAFRNKEDAEAFALNENLLRVEADLREVGLKTEGDINNADVEKLILNKPDYLTNPFLMTALKSATSAMDLDVKISQFKNIKDGKIVSVRDSQKNQYVNNPDFILMDATQIKEDGKKRLKDMNVLNAANAFMGSLTNDFYTEYSEDLQKSILKQYLNLGMYPGLGSDDVDAVYSAMGAERNIMNAEQGDRVTLSEIAEDMANPANIYKLPELNSQAFSLITKSRGDSQHLDTLIKLVEKIPNASEYVKTEERETPEGTIQQQFYRDENGRKRDIGEPSNVTNQNSIYTTYEVAGDKANEKNKITTFSEPVFQSDLNLVKNIIGTKARLPKIATVYGYGIQPFLEGNLHPDYYSDADDNLITALIKARDDSQITLGEYEKQLAGMGFIESLEWYRNSFLKGARLTDRQRRSALKILHDIYAAAKNTESALFKNQKRIFDSRYGSDYKMAPHGWHKVFSETTDEKFNVFASLAGINPSLYSESQPSAEQIFAANPDYFKPENAPEGAGGFQGSRSAKGWMAKQAQEVERRKKAATVPSVEVREPLGRGNPQRLAN